MVSGHVHVYFYVTPFLFLFSTDDQSESDDSVKMILSMSRDQLLLGLGDESNEVK